MRVAAPVPVRGMFETHLSVTDLDRAVAFYRDIVGLPVALEIPERGATFLWVVERGQGMLGLWSLGSMPMGLSLDVAFDVALEDVIPAAAVYFRDPDGHQLEYLAMLDDEPRPELGVLSFSEWNRAGEAGFTSGP